MDEDHGSQEERRLAPRKKTVKLPSTHHSSKFDEIQIYHPKQGKDVDGYRCQLCQENFSSRNKTCIKRHLQSKHSSVYKELEGILYLSLNIIIIKGIIVSVFIAKDEEEREKIRSSVRDQAGVAAVDLLFPSPSGSSIGQGKKRKVCYTYALHILDALFWGNKIHFSRITNNSNKFTGIFLSLDQGEAGV